MCSIYVFHSQQECILIDEPESNKSMSSISFFYRAATHANNFPIKNFKRVNWSLIPDAMYVFHSKVFLPIDTRFTEEQVQPEGHQRDL